MAHILAQQEALDALRATSDDPTPGLEVMLSGVDDYLESATGHDWTADTAIDPKAKLAATILLVNLSQGTEPTATFTTLIGQLHAKVLELEGT